MVPRVAGAPEVPGDRDPRGLKEFFETPINLTLVFERETSTD